MPDHYDIVIVGGGIHGVGVAQAAAAGGYSVLVIEKTALAAGTSSKSSKLIHGGLRYLESYDFGLVRESLHERKLLLELAPELVRLKPFYIPIYRTTSRRPLTIRAGLSLYALLGGLDKSCLFRKLHKNEWAKLDGLKTDGLQVVYRYFDAQTNDLDLTRAVMHSAEQLGARLICPAEFIRAHINRKFVSIDYIADGNEHTCQASVMVNAGGPWINEVTARIVPQLQPAALEHVQGTHLIVEGPVDAGCYYMESPTDRRAIFLSPWKGHGLLGTTGRSFTGRPEDVHVTASERSYLLAIMQHYFPGRSLEVLDEFAGLRVLPVSDDSVFSRSRETQLPVDDETTPRVITIFGGKLTGYRATADKVIKIAQRTLSKRKPLADTTRLKLTPV